MEPINTPFRIAILMATYNGEQYLGEQIDSLLAQTFSDWHLFIHDDGSTDHTVSIVREYVRQQPERITLLEYPSQGGACNNFLSLLERVEAPYYMFCDQDDVWNKDKIQTEMERMQLIEEKATGSHPVLVYSDLMVVDASLRTLSNSFFDYSGIYPEFLTTFSELGAANPTTGCTMLFNQAVKDLLSFPLPDAVMHDALITLYTLKAKGSLVCIRKPLLSYRQHDSNTLGADEKGNHSFAQRLYHCQRTVRLNREQYRMLQELHYGSFWKYLYNKWKYKMRIICRQSR